MTRVQAAHAAQRARLAALPPTTTGILAERLGVSVFRLGLAIYGPAHVTLDDDVLTDSEVAYAVEYFEG